MSDMFGAPIGIGAAEQDIRQAALGQLQAQKLLGEIAEQPDHAKLVRAHVELYAAQAEKARAAAAEQKKLADLSTEMAAQGRDATVNDLGEPLSGADYLEQFAQLAANKGISPVTTASLYAKAAEIRQKEAATLSTQAREKVWQLDVAKKRAERIGALATLGLQGPQQYDQMRMLAVQEGLPIDQLPQDFTAARPVLQGFVTSSMTAKDTIDTERRKIHEAAQEKRWQSANARDSASVKLAEKRGELITERTQLLRKNGGGTSAEAKEAAQEMAATRRAIREAKVRKEFPPAPLDPSARQPGRTYTAADGKTRFLWDRDPRTGKNVAIVLSGADYGSVGGGKDDVEDLPSDNEGED